MKLFSLKKLILLLIILISLYISYNIFITLQFKSLIQANLSKININYDKVEFSWYPSHLNAFILKPTLKKSNQFSFIEMDDLSISMNPFNINEISITSSKINNNTSTDDLEFFLINNLVSKVSMKDKKLQNIIIISDKINFNFYGQRIGDIKKTTLRMIKDESEVYRINFSGYATNVLESSPNETKILMTGEVSYSNNNLNGNIQLDISDVANNDILFSTPLVIKNWIVSVLFIPVIDLKELFSF